MIFDAARAFGRDFFALLPALAPRLCLAWLATFVLLIFVVQWLRRHIKPQVLRLDSRVRLFAAGLRYRNHHQKEGEMHARTWFFRFWTNFASAPALIGFSLLLPIWAHATQKSPHLFYLPGLSYAGSMLLSFISKRIIKRVRPQRDKGAFGHKLQDGSFPSGHSLTSFCFWIALVVTGVAAGFSVSALWILALSALAIVLLTGLSRVYLAVHFPSDVLGGFCIGIAWVAVCSFALLPVLQNS